MEEYQLHRIGIIRKNDDDVKIVLDNMFSPALIGLGGFSHIQVLWWFSQSDHQTDRHILTVDSPYRKAPEVLGVFATRSPQRPNPIALSCAQITYIDEEHAEIGLAFLEAYDGTPVLDIKPYSPSLDRVEHPRVPEWCAHWPKSYETSGSFDWENELK